MTNLCTTNKRCRRKQECAFFFCEECTALLVFNMNYAQGNITKKMLKYE